jgi:monoamine oxidase
MGNLWWGERETSAKPLAQITQPMQSTIQHILKEHSHLASASLPVDLSLADYFRQQGVSDLDTAEVLLAQTCCAPIDTLSCHDLAREMRADHAGHGESRIREGYSALLAWYSRNLPIRFNSPVSEIQWGKEGVQLKCDVAIFSAQRCIITVPVSILQRSICFVPALPADKQWAINSFGFEPATKLIYRFREQFWSDDLTYMAHEGITARWWTPGYHRHSTPLICAYVTAERARHIDAMSEEMALAFGLQELQRLLPTISLEQMQALCVAAKCVSWGHDPYARGGYAYVPVGGAECRPLLARSESGVLFFAGEATAYDSNPQTIHGALESGWRAARECLEAMQ